MPIRWRTIEPMHRDLLSWSFLPLAAFALAWGCVVEETPTKERFGAGGGANSSGEGGSFVAAYIMAFAESLVVFLVPMGSFLKGSVALSIMILVLVVRPEGLFGVAFEEER